MGYVLPVRPDRFADVVALSGWRVRVEPRAATGGGTHLTVRGCRGDQWEISATWHTHPDGTCRLCTCTVRTPDRDWHSLPLTAAASLLNQCDPAEFAEDDVTAQPRHSTRQESS